MLNIELVEHLVNKRSLIQIRGAYLLVAIEVKIKQLNEESRKIKKIKLRKQLIKLNNFYKILK